MSTSEKPAQSSGGDLIGALTVILSFMFKGIAKGIYFGAFRKKTWTKNFVFGWLGYSGLVTAIVFAPRWNLLDIVSLKAPRLAGWLYWHVSATWQILLLTVLPFLGSLAVIGLFDWLQRQKLQKQVQHLGLKTHTGLEPSVVRVIELPNYQRKVLVKAIGIDVNDFRSRKDTSPDGSSETEAA